MPSADWNREVWDRQYSWDEGGDEWSWYWGGAEAQWSTTVEPRIAPFLPADTLLEIAPGFGRWTRFLISECSSYVGVDMSERCIESCRERFADCPHATFAVNDGRSLPNVADASVDLVFSLDSLVHVDETVMGAYLLELQRVLKGDGVALLHHSNLREFRGFRWRTRPLRALARAVTPLRGFLKVRGIYDWEHSRDWSMSADRFVALAGQAGLVCIGQEIVNWGSCRLIDCISLVTPPGSRFERANVRVVNQDFMAAARSSAAASKVFISLGNSDLQGAPRQEGPVS